MKNFFKHLKIINSHRFKVMKFCIKAGIPINGFKHDLSKYSKAEFVPSCKYYQGTSSPIVEERTHNFGYSDISIHHTNKNKHHYEYLQKLADVVHYKDFPKLYLEYYFFLQLQK